MYITFVDGHLGADARLTEKNGKFYLSFNLAHTERFTKQNGDQVENTVWINCIRKYTNRPDSIASKLLKGVKVVVSGKPNIGLKEYEGKKSIDYNINFNEIVFTS